MAAEPLVSVVMPAYNSASFISAAIESILVQTHPGFELLVIDDGSTDGTGAIVQNYARGEPRIRLIARDHLGLVNSLNFGLQQATGSYLARLDADDRAFPTRLEKQLACLESHPERVIVGSACQLMTRDDVPIRLDFMPESDTAVRWHNLFHCPFIHSSVMLRLETLRTNRLEYDPAMQAAEDYELWSRLLRYGQGYNLSEPLVYYRLHPSQASQQGQSQLWEHASRVAQNNLNALGVPLPLEHVYPLRKWYYHFPRRFSAQDLAPAQALLNILNLFSLQPCLDSVEVHRLRGRWLGRLVRACLGSRDPGWYSWLFRQLTLADYRSILAYLRER
jgi:glycosyltransferase involved in cell wall biosynthesis